MNTQILEIKNHIAHLVPECKQAKLIRLVSAGRELQDEKVLGDYKSLIRNAENKLVLGINFRNAASIENKKTVPFIDFRKYRKGTKNPIPWDLSNISNIGETNPGLFFIGYCNRCAKHRVSNWTGLDFNIGRDFHHITCSEDHMILSEFVACFNRCEFSLELVSPSGNRHQEVGKATDSIWFWEPGTDYCHYNILVKT